MKKKFLSVLLIAAMSLSVFAGCGSNNSDTQKNGKVSLGEEESTKSPYAITGEVGDGVELKEEEGKSVNSMFKSTYERMDGIATRYYNFTLADKDGNAVQPNGTVTVSIAKSDLPEGKNYVVYYVAEDSFEKMNSYVDDDKLSFETTHFSTYAVLGYSDEVDSAVFLNKMGGEEDTANMSSEKKEKLSKRPKMIEGYSTEPEDAYEALIEEKYGPENVYRAGVSYNETEATMLYVLAEGVDPSILEYEKDKQLAQKTCDFIKNVNCQNKKWDVYIAWYDLNGKKVDQKHIDL